MDSNNNEKRGRKNSFNVKQEKNMKTIIVYDLESLPEGNTIQDILDFYQSTGMLLYSSSKEGKDGGQIPRVMEMENPVSTVSINSKPTEITISSSVGTSYSWGTIHRSNWLSKYSTKKSHVLLDQNGTHSIVSQDVINWLELGTIERQGIKVTYIQGDMRYQYLGAICG